MDQSATPDPFDYSNQRLLREKASTWLGNPAVHRERVASLAGW